MRSKIASTPSLQGVENAEAIKQSHPTRHCEIRRSRIVAIYLIFWIASLRSLMLTRLAMTKTIKQQRSKK